MLHPSILKCSRIHFLVHTPASKYQCFESEYRIRIQNFASTDFKLMWIRKVATPKFYFFFKNVHTSYIILMKPKQTSGTVCKRTVYKGFRYHFDDNYDYQTNGRIQKGVHYRIRIRTLDPFSTFVHIFSWIELKRFEGVLHNLWPVFAFYTRSKISKRTLERWAVLNSVQSD